MDFEVIWTDPAVDDLEAALRYIAEQDPAAAESFRLELPESVEILARLPFIGPAYERDPSGRAREILCRRRRIFYCVEDAQHRVVILTVWHSSRREPRLPR